MSEREKYDSGRPEVETSAAGAKLPPAVDIRRPEEIAAQARSERLAAIKRSLGGISAEPEVVDTDQGPTEFAQVLETEVLETEVLETEVLETEVLETEVVAESDAIETDLSWSDIAASDIAASDIAASDIAANDTASGEVVDAEVVESDFIDYRASASDVVDTELVDTELVDTELVDTELVDTELVDTEVLDTDVVEGEAAPPEFSEIDLPSSNDDLAESAALFSDTEVLEIAAFDTEALETDAASIDAPAFAESEAGWPESVEVEGSATWPESVEVEGEESNIESLSTGSATARADSTLSEFSGDTTARTGADPFSVRPEPVVEPEQIDPDLAAPEPFDTDDVGSLPVLLDQDKSELPGGPLSVSGLEAVPPEFVEPPAPQRNRSGPIVLAAAVALAVVSGILATLWLRERSAANDLRSELVAAEAGVDVTDRGLGELNDEIETLQLRNSQLEQQLNDMSALVLELPAGRVTEIDVPFTPVLADEENNRLIAMSEDGSFIVWGEGADGPITDSGEVSGSPTGLFASLRKAWVSTDAGRIEILSLANEDNDPAVEFGPTAFLAAEERGYWTYNADLGEIVRLRKADGGITSGVAIPVDVVDLTIGAGSVWALGDDGRVYRVNTVDFTIQAFDAGEDLISITAGPDSLWTLSAADGALRRVDPVSGEVLVTVPVGRDPIDAAFAGNSVWVALRAGTSLIEVDTRTSAVISRTMMPSEPTALHQGDTGVFVTMDGETPLVRVSSLLTNDIDDDAEAEADGADPSSDADGADAADGTDGADGDAAS